MSKIVLSFGLLLASEHISSTDASPPSCIATCESYNGDSSENDLSFCQLQVFCFVL